MAKYKLSTVQANVLERELMLLLLGVEDTNDFVETLADEAQIPQEILKDLLPDIDNQLAIAIEGRPNMGTGNPQGVPQAPVRVAPPPQVQMPIYSAPPLQSPRYVRADEEVVAFRAAPLPPKMAMPAQKAAPAPAAVVTTAPAVAKAPEAKPRPMAALAEHSVMDPAMEALPVGEVEPKVAPQPVVPAPVAVPSVPVLPPPPVQPSPAPAGPKLRLADPVAPPAPKAFVTPPVPVRPPSADDPYREPIDQI